MAGAACFSATALRSESAGWEEPRLRKEFLGSYGIDSRVEPDLSDTQREVLQQLEPLLRDDKSRAVTVLEEAGKTEPSARYDFLLGNLKLEAGRVEEAKRHYSDAIRKFPNYRQAYKNLGLILAQEQDFPMAAKALSKVLELGEADGTAYGLLARCHQAAGNLVAAESGFRQAVLLQPDVLDWRRGLLATFIRQRKTSDAIALADELIARDPENPEFHLQKGQVQLASGDLEGAAATLELVARAGWAKAPELHQLGDIYLKQEQPQLALSAYRRAFALDPAQAPAKCLRAVEVLAASRAPVEAAELAAAFRSTFGERIEAPDRARLARIEARIALAQKADERAAALLREATEADPLDGDAWMLLGKYHADRKEEERAIFMYERAAGIEAFKADAKVKIAQLLVGQSKLQEAVGLLKEAQQLRPRDSIARYLEQVEKVLKSRSGGR